MLGSPLGAAKITESGGPRLEMAQFVLSPGRFCIFFVLRLYIQIITAEV